MLAVGRLQIATLVGVGVWLAGFGWLDDRLSAGLVPGDAWEWDESLVDFVRWLGWIPLVIALERWRGRARARTAPR